MTGDERLRQLGFDPKNHAFRSSGGNIYYLYWSADAAYDPKYDDFRLLQDTGMYGGRGVRHVKARNLKKYWKQW